MSRKEKEKFMEMALLSLQCKDDFKEDYYYKVSCSSKVCCHLLTFQDAVTNYKFCGACSCMYF